MTHPIDNEFLVLLHDVARLHRVRVDQVARTRGMTRAQWVTLVKVERQPGLSQADLAALLEVEPITVARTVDRLEAHGLVERRPDPKDRRIWRLHLTATAKPVLEEITKYRAEFQREITAGIDAEALEIIREGLLAMKANLNAANLNSKDDNSKDNVDSDGRTRTAV